jgi:hypothetical protein
VAEGQRGGTKAARHCPIATQVSDVDVGAGVPRHRQLVPRRAMDPSLRLYLDALSGPDRYGGLKVVCLLQIPSICPPPNTFNI